MKNTKHLTVLLWLAFSITAHAATANDAETEAFWRKYYSEHLPEAKKMLEACIAKGPQNVLGVERVKCSTAMNAWHFQPYKPKPPTFSSSGGRH